MPSLSAALSSAKRAAVSGKPVTDRNCEIVIGRDPCHKIASAVIRDQTVTS
ncbi:MAG: hypothetical protein AAGF54_18585 [Pseudomonadota bacterium]